MTWERYGQDRFEEGEEIGAIRGTVKTVIDLLREGLISLPDAARHAGMSEEELKARMAERV